MPLLNTADKIYIGSALAAKVYLGTVQVWPPSVSVTYSTAYAERKFEELGAFVTVASTITRSA